MVSLSRVCPRPIGAGRVSIDQDERRQPGRVKLPAGIDQGERVEGLDQDARRQPGRVVSLSRSCPRPSLGSAPIGNRRVSIDQGSVSRASTRMHVGNRPRGEPVEVLPAAVARVHTVRQPGRVKLPASIDRGSVSRASTRMDVGSRPRGERVEVLPAAVARVRTDRQPPRVDRPGERVEGLDQDARRQPRRVVSLSRSCPRPIVARARVSPPSQFRAEKKIRGLRLPRRAGKPFNPPLPIDQVSLSRSCPRPIGIPADHFSGNTICTDRQPRRVKLPGSIDQGNVSRASTRKGKTLPRLLIVPITVGKPKTSGRTQSRRARVLCLQWETLCSACRSTARG